MASKLLVFFLGITLLDLNGASRTNLCRSSKNVFSEDFWSVSPERCFKGPQRAQTPTCQNGDLYQDCSRNDITCLKNMETSTSRLLGAFADLVAKVVERWRRSRSRSKVSSQCQRDLGNFVEGLLNLEEWAVQMADSYGRPGPGLTRGQKTFVGDYGQCRDIVHSLSSGRSLRGQFCTLTTKTHLMSHAPNLARMFYLLDTVDVHVCVPNSCFDDDVIAVFGDTIASFGGEVLGAACVREKNPSADPFYRLAVFVLSVLLILCLAGTVLDLVSKVNSNTCGSDTRAFALDKEDDVNNNRTTGQVSNEDEIRFFKEKCARVLLCFSLPQNMRDIFSTDVSDDIPSIHGVRFLTTVWLAMLHSWTQYRLYGNLLGNPEDVHKLYKVWWFFTFFCLPLGVDTFLTLSGFLAVFSFLRHFQRKNGVGSTKILLTYFSHRLWRLGPPLAMMLLVFYGVVPYLCIGPFDLSSEDQDLCRPRIWTTLFFVNNLFMNMSDFRCALWTWTLALDIQYHLLFGLLVLLPWALGQRRTGIIVCCAFIALHIIYILSLNKSDLTSAEMMTDPEERVNIHLEMYFGPWAKTAPFVVGLLLGYTLCRHKQHYILKPMTVFLGWLSSTCACLSVIGVNYYNLKDLYDHRRFNLTDGQASLLEALSRPLWAFGVAWVIFACTVGYGGAVNRLLSWRGWVPLSRLSYSVYLWHNVVHAVISYNRWESFTLTPWTAIESFFSSTIFAFGVALLFALLVEWPTLTLRRLFCLKNSKGA